MVILVSENYITNTTAQRHHCHLMGLGKHIFPSADYMANRYHSPVKSSSQASIWQNLYPRHKCCSVHTRQQRRKFADSLSADYIANKYSSTAPQYRLPVISESLHLSSGNKFCCVQTTSHTTIKARQYPVHRICLKDANMLGADNVANKCHTPVMSNSPE